MREEFAREFPSVGRALSTSRSRLLDRASKLRRESVVWGTVSGIGAGFLVAAVTQFLVGLLFVAVRAFDITTPLTLGWLQVLVGTAVAVAVALRVGGPLSLALYLVYVGVGLAARIPGLAAFCERPGFGNLLAFERCTPLGFLASEWAVWCGIGVGLLLSRAIAARGEGRNLTLRVAGAYAIAWDVVLSLVALILALSEPVVAFNYSLAISALAVAAGAAAGVVAALSDRHVRSATVVAVVLVLPWLTTQLPLLISQIGMAAQSTTSSDYVPAMLIGAFSTPVAALALVLTAVVADRQRFIPRDTA